MKALYAGSFDPFTIGHYDIAQRALKIFGSLIIGIGYNENKKGEFSVEKRVENIKKIFSGNRDVEVEAYTGLTIDFAKAKGARFLVRGIRNSIDFEKEKELAEINMEIGDIDTIFLPSRPELAFVSSSMVRELLHNGYDVAKYLPRI